MSSNGPLRVGIGGPVGSGKTALTEALCRSMRDDYSVAAITNDIYTREDAEFLLRAEALPAERIVGVETGGCPHTAIREDASMNLAAIDDMNGNFPDLDVIFIESGGDNLAATFSPELADITIYVIDVSAGDKIPRKGGPGITKSDLLVINKIDLAPLVGADLGVMDRDAKKMRGDKPFLFTNLKAGDGVAEIRSAIENKGRPLSTRPGCYCLGDFDQLYREVKRLSCQRVVAIDGNRVLLHLGDNQEQRLTIIAFCLQLHTDSNLHVLGQLVSRNLLD